MTRMQRSTYCLRANRAARCGCLNAAAPQQRFVIPGGENFPFAHQQRVGMPRGFLVDHLALPTLPAIAQVLTLFVLSGF